MFQGTNCEKIATKLANLKTAVFLDFSESIVKFPTSIVPIISANKDKEIWLSLPRPYPDISGMEKAFPVALHFYDKKIDYYMNVDGVAKLVSNGDVMPDNMTRRLMYLDDNELLICVKMTRVEYYEKRRNRNVHLLDRKLKVGKQSNYTSAPVMSYNIDLAG